SPPGVAMIRVRPLTPADLPLGMRLKEAAGWNQTEADWRRFLDLEPEGCFVAELDGTPSATLAAFVFGPVAWIAMVLVDPAMRRGGLAGALMVHALDWLDRRDVGSVRLDATPMGQPLYEELGFVVEYSLGRHEGVLPAAPEVGGVDPARAEDMNDVRELDRSVTGADRGKV